MRDINRDKVNQIRGVLIMLVVVGHFVQYVADYSSNTVQQIIRAFILLIYSFHMPLFIGVSGFLSTNLDKCRDTAIVTLMVPYIFSQLILGFVRGTLGGVVRNFLIPQFGLWYMISLCIWRLLLKDILKIKGYMIWAGILYIATIFFADMGTDLAFHRTFGFLIFFLIGYEIRVKGMARRNIHKKKLFFILSVSFLVAEVFAFTWIVHIGKYELLIDTFCHRIVYTDFENWIIAPLLYIGEFALIIVNSTVFLSNMEPKRKLFEKVGQDTMPLYISHLVVYLALCRISTHFEFPNLIYVLCGVLCTIVSIVFFSCDWYRRFFHTLVGSATNLLIERNLKE